MLLSAILAKLGTHASSAPAEATDARPRFGGPVDQSNGEPSAARSAVAGSDACSPGQERLFGACLPKLALPKRVQLAVAHIYQGSLGPGKVCRHAALMMIRRFIKASPNLDHAKKMARSVPREIYNGQVDALIPHWPGLVKGPIRFPARDKLTPLLKDIDGHLDAGLPALVYVTHNHKGGGVHVVVVTGRDYDEQGNPTYQFLDPGTRYEQNAAGTLVFSRSDGNYVKTGTVSRSSSVPQSRYWLLGVYSYDHILSSDS
jgi:hypothetical protein